MKRTVDVVGAGLVLLPPVLAVVAVVVRWRLDSPVLFRQERPGLDRVGPSSWSSFGPRPTIPTVRCWTTNSARPGSRRGCAPPRWMKLPELVNVLGGDMSLVGPRPLLTEYLDLYIAEQARRHESVPGSPGGPRSTAGSRRMLPINEEKECWRDDDGVRRS